MTTARILVLDDDEMVLRSLVAFLEAEGHEIHSARSVQEAAEIVESTPLDLLLADVYMPDGTAFKLLEDVKQAKPDLDVVLVTGYGTIEDAIHAIKSGASNYITKPLVDDEIRLVIEQTLRRSSLRHETEDLRVTARNELGLDNVVCKDDEMLQVVRMARTMSKARTTVLITGESGTGKTMIARAMHYESDRSQGPFIEMTCGALTETLLEAELFGVEAGAFTGATHQKEGKFEAADGGTIFLDEIANASPSLQVKLLRLIQDSCFERVGGTETIVTDTRVILATNVDLAREVADGRFREDLYYRVNVVPIHVPPLRDRRKDIPDLVNHLVRKHAHASEKAIGDVSPAAMQILTAHAWPGNVRQLENIVERAVVLARGDTVEVSELPSELLTTAPSAPAHAGKTDVIIPLKKALEEPERQIILRAIEYAGGNRDEAAKLLGINRSTLFYKLRKLKVKVPAATAG
jgi:DNA-binding NtrC family response regulator